jgi:hypothetical protein
LIVKSGSLLKVSRSPCRAALVNGKWQNGRSG